MQRFAIAPFALAAAMVWCLPAVSVHAAEPAATLVQDLTQGGLQTVLWTRREKSCTLQFLFPVNRANTFIGKTIAELKNLDQASPKVTPPTPMPPIVQAWLIRADGTVILPVEQLFPKEGSSRDTLANDVQFTYPLSAGREAVAAAIRINDNFYVKQLKPFAD